MFQGPKRIVQGPGSTIQPAKAECRLNQLVDPSQALPKDSQATSSATILRICRISVSTTRELWHAGADSHAFEQLWPRQLMYVFLAALSFEINAGKVLMHPKDRRQMSSRQAFANWYISWPEMSASPYHHRQGLFSSKYWHARLAACGMWHAVILAACSPEPKATGWRQLKLLHSVTSESCSVFFLGTSFLHMKAGRGGE